MELKLNRSHHLLVYADNMNLLGRDIDTIKKNTEILTDARKKISLEANAKKTQCMLQDSGQNHDS
jgi:hypothetical protein